MESAMHTGPRAAAVNRKMDIHILPNIRNLPIIRILFSILKIIHPIRMCDIVWSIFGRPSYVQPILPSNLLRKLQMVTLVSEDLVRNIYARTFNNWWNGHLSGNRNRKQFNDIKFC